MAWQVCLSKSGVVPENQEEQSWLSEGPLAERDLESGWLWGQGVVLGEQLRVEGSMMVCGSPWAWLGMEHGRGTFSRLLWAKACKARDEPAGGQHWHLEPGIWCLGPTGLTGQSWAAKPSLNQRQTLGHVSRGHLDLQAL